MRDEFVLLEQDLVVVELQTCLIEFNPYIFFKLEL